MTSPHRFISRAERAASNDLRRALESHALDEAAIRAVSRELARIERASEPDARARVGRLQQQSKDLRAALKQSAVRLTEARRRLMAARLASVVPPITQ